MSRPTAANAFYQADRVLNSKRSRITKFNYVDVMYVCVYGRVCLRIPPFRHYFWHVSMIICPVHADTCETPQHSELLRIFAIMPG